jgi:hypothetical protein
VELFHDLLREPTPHELAKEIGISVEIVLKLQQYAANEDFVWDEVESVGVRVVLEAAGIDLPAGCSATELTENGKPRWAWEPLDPTTLGPGAYRQALTESIRQRVAWRSQYEQARDATGPPGVVVSHSATAPASSAA